MNSAATHLCLVSEQPLPNVLPALDKDHPCAGVVLAVSPQMRDSAQSQKRVLDAYKIPCDVLELPSAYDMPAIAACIEAWLSQQSNKSIWLNATGGTKPMAMAAQAVFSARNLPVFYLQVQTGKVFFLSSEQAGYQAATRMKLTAFVAAHGLTLIQQSKPTDDYFLTHCTDLIQWMGQNAKRLLPALADIKRTLSNVDADSRLSENTLPPAAKRSAELSELLERLTVSELIRLEGAPRPQRIKLKDNAVTGFITGGWLERYVLLEAKALPDLQDTAWSMLVAEGKHLKGDYIIPRTERNEIDIALLRNNVLFALECKSTAADQGYVDHLYKVAFQRRLGGLTARAGIVGLTQPNASLRERASNSRIALFGLDCLPHLKDHLESWLAKGQLP